MPGAIYRSGRGRLFLVIAVASIASGSVASPAGAAAPAACGTTFTVVATPDPGSETSELQDVVSLGTDDVWAVGFAVDGTDPPQPQTLHAAGSVWTEVPSPGAGSPENGILSSVDGVASNDVWAVGSFTGKKDRLQTLIEHWTGAGWSVVKSPNAGKAKNGELGGVDARASNDAWAVGSYTNKQGIVLTLVERWDGSKWKIVPSPNPSPPGAPPNGGLGAVHALSATNAWAVGSFLDDSALPQPLVEHWNGTAWSIVATPDLGADEAVFADVTAVSSTAVWTVGFRDTATLVERWNGSAWNVVPSPNPGSRHIANLAGITVIKSGDLWAAGSYVTDTPSLGTLVEHWNGSQWSVAASNNAAGDDSLAAIGGNATEVWAVGNVLPPSGPVANLALHRCPG